MTPDDSSIRRIPGYCAMCVSRCGSIAVVEDGRFTALEPDPSHPTGKALCAKGRAAPELVAHPDRLTRPLKRTRRKGAPDPGWEPITWDEALDRTAARLRELADEHGPESVVFSMASPSTSASDDTAAWIDRLRRACGSPNMCASMELCGWGRYFATGYTYGAPVPGRYMPDLEHAGCILFWGYNPNLARLSHAVPTQAALKRGAKLVVVDPRRVGPAAKADRWLRVRPGTDAALALGIARAMISNGWYDDAFVREWTNGPLLVRQDDGRLLTERDLAGDGAGPDADAGAGRRYVVWNAAAGRTSLYDPATGAFEDDPVELALAGEASITTPAGPVTCEPAFGLVAAACSHWTPERVEATCGVPGGEVEATARLLWDARPLAYYAWSGVEMQTGSTQIARAIAQIHALTGSFDVKGGNVLFGTPPTNDVTGRELLSDQQRLRALGREARPLGPGRWEFVTSGEVYRAILEKRPYPVRGLVGFGANLLMAHADGRLGREALQALDFYVHADLFMNPTAEMADIVLPVASPFEREALRIGFEISADAHSHVQLRPAVAEPRGEARSDMDIVFDLAVRLGLGSHFFDGDTEAAWRHQLAPSGISLDELRANPGGIRAPVETRYRKYAEQDNGGPPGFNTPTRRVELYSEALRVHGYPPVPTYEAPGMSPASRPELADRFPLILTCAKHTLFCETQHRALPSLRRRAMDPEVELHPEDAAARGIEPGDWVRIATPAASIRARAALNESLEPGVVCGQHGWWQACDELDAPGYDPFGADSANFNLLIGRDAVDAVSGSVPHRAYLCQVHRMGE